LTITSLHSPSSPIIVLLAAGESRRFGGIKQLVEIDGQPMLRRVARTVLDQGVPVIAVTGAHAERVEAVLDDLPLQIIRHAGWQDGMGSSLAAGIRCVEAWFPQASAVLLCLADQPLLGAPLFETMLQRHREAPDRLLVTEQHGISGPPVLFPRDCFAALTVLSGSRGAYALIEREAARVERFTSTDGGDVNTPQDLQRIRDWLATDDPR
jgi:molybdenum cofactor cytidylyltransferase